MAASRAALASSAVALATRGDFVLGGRIDDVEAAAVGGFAPFTADPQIGRDVGKQIVVHAIRPSRPLRQTAAFPKQARPQIMIYAAISHALPRASATAGWVTLPAWMLTPALR